MMLGRILSAIALLTIIIGALFFQFSAVDKHDHTATTTAPVALDDESECEACAMYVSEQPAPRGQLIYRDGSRRFFCSVGDLLSFLTIPSSLGRAIEIWVEGMPADMAPATNSTTLQPWVNIHQASFVTGIKRAGVMGMPAISFASREDAETFISQHGGELNNWAALKKSHQEHMLRKQQ
ncbi:MAG: nitrous oxide reductase accessory protein NosL [Candidatus Polarisedimenticolaceae bacterium]|nr:nitrous oxide reductase accessory protein NosL [Candidatus Polarisedimenticolaceae bacterium]